MKKRFFVIALAVMFCFSTACGSNEEPRIVKGDLGHYHDTAENVTICDTGSDIYLQYCEINSPDFELLKTFSDGRTINSLADHTFNGNETIVNLIIPDGYKYIGHFSFLECPNLETVYIGKDVQHIGELAFSGCPKLKYFKVSPDNQYFYDKDGCIIEKESEKLVVANSNIPKGIRTIGCNAYGGNTNISDVFVPDGVSAIQAYAFTRSTAEVVYLPDSLEIIEGAAFSMCSNLESIYIPDSVSNIEASIMYGIDGIVINCEAESKPEGWDDDWLDGCTNYQLNWGVKRDI